MKQYTGMSADDVWRMAVSDLMEYTEYESSTRGGETVELLQCTLSISDPKQRWISSRKPVYNPAFGLVEFVWIFNGENDSDVLRFWNPKLPDFLDLPKFCMGHMGIGSEKALGLIRYKELIWR